MNASTVEKLGILVVYMAREEHEELLDLHLSAIERHTTVPYTIYGSINRLLPRLESRIEKHRGIKLYQLPETDLRGLEEHSYYLEKLLKIAVEDDVSHIAILHMDSFPIRDGWAEELASKLSKTSVFSSIEGINTACLFLHRDFYVNYQPLLLVSEDQQHSSEYANYLRDVTPIVHSGIGYGFKAYREKLQWYSMRPTSQHAGSSGPAIYDDLIFHLRGAVRLSTAPPRKVPTFLRRFGYECFDGVQRAIRAVSPNRRGSQLRLRFRRTMEFLIDDTRLAWQAGDLNFAYEQLLKDPAAYIQQLRGAVTASTR